MFINWIAKVFKIEFKIKWISFTGFLSPVVKSIWPPFAGYRIERNFMGRRKYAVYHWNTLIEKSIPGLDRAKEICENHLNGKRHKLVDMLSPEIVEKIVKIIKSCQTVDQLGNAQDMAHNYSDITYRIIKEEMSFLNFLVSDHKISKWKCYNSAIESAIHERLGEFAPWLKLIPQDEIFSMNPQQVAQVYKEHIEKI
jgi:hypothetical protein